MHGPLNVNYGFSLSLITQCDLVTDNV